MNTPLHSDIRLLSVHNSNKSAGTIKAKWIFIIFFFFLWVDVSFADALWSGWREVPGGGSTDIADTAASYNGSLYLFGIGYDHRHYVNVYWEGVG